MKRKTATGWISGWLILFLGMGSALIVGTAMGQNAGTQLVSFDVPPPVKKSKAETVVVHLEAKEYVGELKEGVKYTFWSFDGQVPGPLVRVGVGDTVEFHLSNDAKNTMDHSIDIHAVNGPGGGAAVNAVKPGKTRVFSFKALTPGLYIYHCASGQIVDHISNGMYGLFLVEPEGGLPPVDHEYYVMRSEFYLTDKPNKDGVYEFDIKKGLDENPTHIVFNGSDDGLKGDNVLQAKTGETVRIFFGNIGPNKTASFHIIGEIFDKVYVEGAIGGTVNRNVQTTVVPSAGAAIVEFKVDVPGAYTLVDHSIFRVAKGAIGQLVVEGEEQPKVFRAGK